MKTKELIRQLQELDPEGECQVFADGDIFFAEKLPWYYDGKPGILIRDESKKGEDNIKGMRQIDASDGDKIYLHCMGLQDLAWVSDLVDFIIEGDKQFKEKYQKYKEDAEKLTKNKTAI